MHGVIVPEQLVVPDDQEQPNWFAQARDVVSWLHGVRDPEHVPLFQLQPIWLEQFVEVRRLHCVSVPEQVVVPVFQMQPCVLQVVAVALDSDAHGVGIPEQVPVAPASLGFQLQPAVTHCVEVAQDAQL